MEKMTIHQCETRAQKEGFDTATFDLCGPAGKKSCKWQDAYMSLVEIEGTLVLVNSQMYSLPVDRLWCENFNSGAKE
jgi:hypothetical protein